MAEPGWSGRGLAGGDAGDVRRDGRRCGGPPHGACDLRRRERGGRFGPGHLDDVGRGPGGRRGRRWRLRSPGRPGSGAPPPYVRPTVDRQGISVSRIVRGPAIGVSLSNDPLVGQQWFLRNTGQNGVCRHGRDPGRGPAALGRPCARSHRQGREGWGDRHGPRDPPSRPGRERGAWFLELPRPGRTTRAHRPDSTRSDHGTAVTGIIGMVYGNGTGGMGVAPGVGLNAYNAPLTGTSSAYVKALGGSSSQPTSSDVWIFNQSYGTSGDEPRPPSTPPSRPSTPRGSRRSAPDGVPCTCGRRGTSSRTTGPPAARTRGRSGPRAGTPAWMPRGRFSTTSSSVHSPPDGRKSSYSSAGSALWVSAPGGEYGHNASVADPSYPPEFYAPAIVTTDSTGCLERFRPKRRGSTACSTRGSLRTIAATTPAPSTARRRPVLPPWAPSRSSSTPAPT